MADFPAPPGRSPRPWQVEAMAATRAAAMDGRKTFLVSAATGTGKGTLLAALLVLAERKGARPVLVSHTEELVADLLDRCRAAGGHPGLVKASAGEWGAPSIVASRQTFVNRLDDLRAYDPRLVLYDEAHLALDAQLALRSSVPGATWIGLTATPFRSAGRGQTEGLGDVYEACVYEYSLRQAIDAGDLCDVKGRRVALDVDLEGCDLSDSDDLSARFNVDAINDAIAADYHAHHAGVPALYFCADVAHAEGLAAAMGPRAAAVSGDDPLRAEKIRAHRAGELDVLCNRDLLVFGYDDPRIAVVGIAAPTASLNRYMQMIGRGTRKGKPHCTVVDYVGSTETLEVVNYADLSRAEKKALAAEKRRADKAARERAETVGGVVEGSRAYEVFILGDAAARRLGAHWYEWQRAFVLAGRRGDEKAAAVVSRDGAGWLAVGMYRDRPPSRAPWVKGEARSLNDDHDLFVLLHRGALDDCATAGTGYLARRGIPLSTLPAAWKLEPATERQEKALRSFGVKKPGLSRGEAVLLLDAVIATRKAREWQRGGGGL